ncbi:MAG: hypothetical protein KGQ86_03580 [Bacteroidetes bacterium]|nr:hypothetical protein [Bacteroidota bacterium]
MNMRHSYIFLFFVLLGTTTCKKESLEPAIIVANIEREFALSYVEKFSKSGRYLQFNVQTLKEQSCGNYTVKTEWSQTPAFMKLNISGIEKKGGCDGTAAIAKGNAVSELITEGTWPIDVDIQNIIRNPGKLIVQKANYQLLLESSHGISLIQKDLQKIPAGSIWGFIAYKPEFAATARVFVEELKKLTRNNALADGDYGYFDVQNEEVKFKDTPSEFSHLPILRSQLSDVDLLLNLVNTFRKNNAGKIVIQLADTNGISY